MRPPIVGPLSARRATEVAGRIIEPDQQSAEFSYGRLRLAVFDLAKSLIKWGPIGDYTAFSPFAP